MVPITLHSDELYRFVAVVFGQQMLPAEVSRVLLFVEANNFIGCGVVKVVTQEYEND